MKKILIFSLVFGIMIVTAGIVAATGGEKVEDANSRYLIKSDNGILKIVYGVNHKFDSGFTTNLTQGQLRVLDRLGVKTKKVAIYTITAKPACDYDGICEPELGENPSCADCKNIIEDPEPELCTPTNQYPWGITKVNGGSGGAGVTVAVLDTGVDQDHPDLVENIIDCTSFGYRTCRDDNGHGTHVAGTIMANGNIIGVAPEADLMAIKVLDRKGRGYTDDIATGIYYAADNGANIISMSLGGSSESSLIKDATDYAISKNVLVIASAGNSGPSEDSIGYPAANINVMAVAAFDSSDVTAQWSSRGINDNDWTIEEREIEFIAPGVAVESTWNNGCYNTISGTSMAAPHITGIAARDWKDGASATRTYLQELAEHYTNNMHDYGEIGDDIEAGFGLPVTP